MTHQGEEKKTFSKGLNDSNYHLGFTEKIYVDEKTYFDV